jgi:transcription elongation factor GreA
MLEERFQQFERLPRDLHEEIPVFTAELREALATFATDALDGGKVDLYTIRLENLEKKRGPALWGDYLRAHLASRFNRVDEWERELLKVADRLAQSEAWDGALHVAEEVLESHPSASAARLRVRASEALGDEPRLEEALEQAWSLDTGNAQVALRLAERARVRADASAELEWRGAALKGLVEISEWAALDECMLAIIEGEEPSAHDAAIDALLALYRAGQADRATGYLDLALPRWKVAPYNERLYRSLRTAVERGVAGEPVRARLLAVMRSLYADFSHLEEFLDASGLTGPGSDLGETLQTWDELWTYRPGLVVEHGSMGLGVIRANDGTRLSIDFTGKPGHAMTVAFARRSLTLLAPGSLKSQLALDREAALERFDSDPAGALADALQDLGGSIKGADLRKHLTHLGFPTKAFAAWWKKAKAAAAEHPRLDDHEAYRDVIHLAREGATTGRSIPMLEPKKGPRAAVTLVNRFLAQHPGRLDDARTRYGSYFMNWASDAALPASDRSAAILILARWFPDHADDWSLLAGSLDSDELDAPSWGAIRDQELWFELLARHARWASLLPPFLGSRKAELRVTAQRTLLERWGEQAPAELERLLQRASELPSVAVALCAGALNQPQLPAWVHPWRAVAALVSVLEGRASDSAIREALGMLDPHDGALIQLVQGGPPPEDLALTLERQLRHWRSSDRYLFGVLEFLRATPAADLAATAEEHRAEALRKLEVPASDSGHGEATLMTRGTFESLVAELERLDRELKTTIPLAIRKARELGDLRENAEYDAAKQRQRETTKRCEQLQGTIHRVKLIEDLDIRDDVAGPGTELKLEGPAGSRVVWILGEGDNGHGPEVVSYLATVGKALAGLKVNERAKLPLDGGVAEYVVMSIRKRLPPEQPSRARGHV